jgi:hypothetical protein
MPVVSVLVLKRNATRLTALHALTIALTYTSRISEITARESEQQRGHYRGKYKFHVRLPRHSITSATTLSAGNGRKPNVRAASGCDQAR